jgi:hypothetical protein
MAYRIQELVRASLVGVVDEWFENEKELFAIYVDTVRGKGGTTTYPQKLDYSAELLEGITPDYFVDQVVDAASEYGQKLRLRCVFLGDDGEPDFQHMPTKRFNLVPETPGVRTGSQGADAATERLSQSLSQGFDTLVRRQEESTDRQMTLLQENGAQTERYFERLMQLQADGSNTVTAQAIQLQAAVSRSELLEFKLQILQESSETSVGTVFLEALPALLGSPLASNLAGALAALANRWGSDLPPDTPPVVVDTPAQPAAPVIENGQTPAAAKP